MNRMLREQPVYMLQNGTAFTGRKIAPGEDLEYASNILTRPRRLLEHAFLKLDPQHRSVTALDVPGDGCRKRMRGAMRQL